MFVSKAKNGVGQWQDAAISCLTLTFLNSCPNLHHNDNGKTLPNTLYKSLAF